MTITEADLRKVAAALDIKQYRRQQEKKRFNLQRPKIIDKVFANKPLTLAEINGICATPESIWAYVNALLAEFPVRAGLCLMDEWCGEVICDGMLLAHSMTRGSAFLPLEMFVFVFASLARQGVDGGVSYAEILPSPEMAKLVDDNWYEIYTGWLGDLLKSDSNTHDLATYRAGENLMAIALGIVGEAESAGDPKHEQACLEMIKDLLFGDRDLVVDLPRRRPARRSAAFAN